MERILRKVVGKVVSDAYDAKREIAKFINGLILDFISIENELGIELTSTIYIHKLTLYIKDRKSDPRIEIFWGNTNFNKMRDVNKIVALRDFINENKDNIKEELIKNLNIQLLLIEHEEE